MPELQQSYADHGRIDPAFHRFLVPISALTIIVAIVNAVLHPGFNSAWLVLVSVAAVVALFKMRLYSLKVQDRLIRTGGESVGRPLAGPGRGAEPAISRRPARSHRP